MKTGNLWEEMREKMVQVFDICTISSNKLKGSGLSSGDIVQVISTKVVPAKKSDPYLQRIYVIVASFVDNKLNLDKTVLVDPRSLTKVDNETKEKYEGYIKEQYKG